MTRKIAPASIFAVLLTGLWLTSPAAADITASNIDAPSSPAHFFADQSSDALAFHVHGTATGTGSVDIDCYDEGGAVNKVAGPVTVSGGEFSADVTQSVAYSVIGPPCVLRAVPTGDPDSHPPSDTGNPFQGPTMLESWGSPSEFSGQIDDYDYVNTGLDGLVELRSAGDGALESSKLFAPGTLDESKTLFDSSGYLTGNAIKVDGADSYVVGGAFPTTGWVPLQVSESLDSATGSMTITSREPLVTCAAGCGSMVPIGVELDRTWKTSHDGTVVAMTDSWRSTDGSAHTLDATYSEGFDSQGGGALKFPGATDFHTYAQNDTVNLPAGPGTVYIKRDPATLDAGDGTNPQGAASYASAPDGAAPFPYVNSNYTEWDAHYVRTIPATGALVLRFAYVQGFALADVEALAQSAAAAFAPSLAISAPANGSTSTTPSVTVSGTASDDAGIASVKVNGQRAGLGGTGSWSAPVSLSPGANTITAVATDADGITTQRQVTVNYTPPAPPPPPVPTAQLSLAGAPRALANGVRFRVSCTAARCDGTATLTATEILQRRQEKLTGVGARRRKVTRHKAVTVGRASFSLQAGAKKTVTVRLNSLGRRLLKRFRRLPVKLSVAPRAPGAKPKTIATKKLTIKVKTKHRKRR